MRNSLAVMLVILGGILCFPASLALWEQRTLAHEESFVELGQDIIDEEPVQGAISKAIADQVRSLAGVDTVTVRSATFSVDQISLEAVKALAGSEAAEAALRGVYKTSRRLAEIDDDTVQVSGDDLVIDLRPTARQVVDRIAADEPALSGVELPPNAGRLTIANAREVGIALDAWRATDQVARLLVVLPLIPFALAVLVASGRGFVLFLTGAALAGGAALRIFLLQGPLDSLLEDLITGDSVYGDAGFAVYGRIVASFARQDVMLIVAGVVVAAVGVGWSVVFTRR